MTTIDAFPVQIPAVEFATLAHGAIPHPHFGRSKASEGAEHQSEHLAMPQPCVGPEHDHAEEG